MARFRHCLGLVMTLALSLPALADESVSREISPPAKAVQLLSLALDAYGEKQALDPDYGEVNQTLLETLAQAIELVETAGPAAAVGMAETIGRWRMANRHLVKEISREAANLPDPAADPLRYRIAQRALYDRIVAGIKRNLATCRQLAGRWQPTPKRP